jgi:hypothetical protein
VLRSVCDIHGSHLRATDGEIGHVAELLFDDRTWRVRWLVADTGHWLPGRRVLIAPAAVAWVGGPVSVGLSRGQVEDAPAAETDLPVSRQHEAELAAHYGWDPWWTTTGDPLDPGAMLLSSPDPEQLAAEAEAHHGDPHLRSTREVIGYHLHATDGDIGHVADLLLDAEGWLIDAAVADPGHRRHGSRTVIDLGWIASIDWLDSSVHLTVDRAVVRAAPAAEAR